MKHLVIAVAVLAVSFQVTYSESLSDDEIDELLEQVTENLLKRRLARLENREHESHKQSMLAAASALAKKQMAARQSENKKGEVIERFLSSSDRILEVALAAKTQLNVIKAYKKEWQRKRGLHSINEDFWKELNEEFDNHILHKRDTIIPTLKKVNGNDTQTSCPFANTPNCTDNHIRRFDGTCNNEKHPLWGGANRAQARLLAPDYSGVDGPRKAKSENDLPSARQVANAIMTVRPRTNFRNTYLSMQFGQFLDHDITDTPVAQQSNGNEITCGSSEAFPDVKSLANCTTTTAECFLIPIPQGDPNFGPGECMHFVRSESYMADDCVPGKKQVANKITAWLDLSNVYGSSTDKNDELRDATTGKMKTSVNTHSSAAAPLNKYLPIDTDAGSGCDTTSDPSMHCFKAGDKRCNEQVGLTAMHTVFVRMHNKMVDKLMALKPSLTAEEVFQLTRKIMTGVWQHMVYNEYLDVILGNQIMRAYDLFPSDRDAFTGYDEEINGDILTAFSTAAFRFGHTEIRDDMWFANKDYLGETPYKLSEIQFNATNIHKSPVQNTQGVESVLYGQMDELVGAWDRFFAEQTRNHLFAANPPHGLGFDLPARNLQRGRDHGLPGYLDFRQICGLDSQGRPRDFNELKDIPFNAQNPGNSLNATFASLYEHVDDIDLYAAGVAEATAPGARVGPTLGCIIALQFRNLKFGDRFYYERITNDGSSFNQGELDEIRRFSISRLMCDTLEDIETIQPKAMLMPAHVDNTEIIVGPNGQTNRRVNCASIPDMDYSVFVTAPTTTTTTTKAPKTKATKTPRIKSTKAPRVKGTKGK